MIVALAAALLLSLHRAGDAGPVVGYGVATLSDQAMSDRLAARFKAHGKPLFLLGDPRSGLQQGDLIRFPDRAVLIDGDVWQTLQAEGALDALRRSQGTVAQLRAKAKSAVWEERKRLVAEPRDKKGYALGAAMLRSLEAASGAIPDGRLQLSFERGELIILAPRSFIDALRTPTSGDDARRTETSHPLFVSAPPERVFAGRPFSWRAWVVDSAGGPSGTIHVELLSASPAGMSWDAPTRTLSGAWPEGRWPLLVVAKGASGRTDTLRTTIHARRNRPPTLTGTVLPAWSGEAWTLHPVASDSDHPAEAVRVHLAQAPPEATWNPATSRVSWNPPDSLVGRKSLFRLVATDPLGDTTEFVSEVQVGRRDPNVSTDGMDVKLPWDTLVAGRTYEWSQEGSVESWRMHGGTLDSVTGCSRTEWDGSRLRIVPSSPGTCATTFHFGIAGKAIPKTHEFPVRSERPPVWLSRTGGEAILVGDTVRYHPYATSPEGGFVRIEPAGPLPDGLDWNDMTLVATPRSRGWMVATLRATDERGQSTDQTVAWKARRSDPLGWSVHQEFHSVATPVEAWLSFGRSGRIGFFVADPARTFLWNEWIEQDWPMLFFGANLTGSTRDQLWLDLGLVVRRPATRVVSGGLVGRIEGRFESPSAIPLQIEYSMLGWVHQAILAVDTAGIHLTISPDSLGSVLDIRDQWEAPIQQILSDSYAPRNVVLLSRLETWYRLHPLLETGPAIWREDRMNDQIYRQYLGMGLRSELVLGPVAIRPALRTGWGPGNTGWGVWGDISVGSRSTSRDR